MWALWAADDLEAHYDQRKRVYADSGLCSMIQSMVDDNKYPPFGGSIFLDGTYLGEADAPRYEGDNWQEGERLTREDLNLRGQLNALPITETSRVFVADANISEAEEWPDVIGEET